MYQGQDHGSALMQLDGEGLQACHGSALMQLDGEGLQGCQKQAEDGQAICM